MIMKYSDVGIDRTRINASGRCCHCVPEILGSSDVDLIIESRFRCFETSPALSIVLSISDLRRSDHHNYSDELCRN